MKLSVDNHRMVIGVLVGILIYQFVVYKGMGKGGGTQGP